MSALQTSKIFVIGGTGAQGLPVVEGLVKDGKYTCRVLTRDPKSSRSRSLFALGNVELVEGSFTNETDLRNGFRSCDGAFVNLDGFNVGEKGEIYWAIRAYELAVEVDTIRFFVYGNLDFVYKKSGYDPKFRSGHYDGKGRIGEWILTQGAEAAARKPPRVPMGVALFTTGPYIEMTIAKGTPMSPVVEKDPKGNDVVTWKVPLTKSGAVPHVSLQDCGHYVRWLFDHPDRANGLDLEVAIEHVDYSELARAFTTVTGHPARFVDVDFDTYWKQGSLALRADYPTGYSADINDPASMSIRDNFTGFWTMWQHSGGNTGVIKRDYALLDEIHPNRIKTVEQWLRIEDEKGRKSGKDSLWERVQGEGLKPILKLHEDGFKSPVANR